MKLYEVAREYKRLLREASSASLGKTMSLRDLLEVGWYSIYSDNINLGNVTDDFTPEELKLKVKVSDISFSDKDGHPCVSVEFINESAVSLTGLLRRKYKNMFQ